MAGFTTFIVLSILSFSAEAAQAPRPALLKQVLTEKLKKLIRGGATERQIVFQDVRAGTPNGTEYPFQVTASIRDYGPGYPRNHYYGQTCVGRMNKRVLTLTPDQLGGWDVQGAMTVSLGPDLVCRDNPAEGVSSMPLSGLKGDQAAAGPAPKAPVQTVQSGAAPISTGEWACYGSGSQVLIGMGFKVMGNGQYTDLDNKAKGTYSVSGSSVTFKGGHLSGQVGRGFRGNSFDTAKMIHCEKYH